MLFALAKRKICAGCWRQKLSACRGSWHLPACSPAGSRLLVRLCYSTADLPTACRLPARSTADQLGCGLTHACAYGAQGTEGLHDSRGLSPWRRHPAVRHDDPGRLVGARDGVKGAQELQGRSAVEHPGNVAPRAGPRRLGAPLRLRVHICDATILCCERRTRHVATVHQKLPACG